MAAGRVSARSIFLFLKIAVCDVTEGLNTSDRLVTSTILIDGK